VARLWNLLTIKRHSPLRLARWKITVEMGRDDVPKKEIEAMTVRGEAGRGAGGGGVSASTNHNTKIAPSESRTCSLLSRCGRIGAGPVSDVQQGLPSKDLRVEKRREVTFLK
jgi:hypothetical protein